MKYSDYKKGSSALRRIINDEELDYSRQFAKFYFHFNERRGPAVRGIWNAKTKNVVAFVNGKGNVFIRPASVYSGQLIGSGTNKVIKNNNLNTLRRQVGSRIKANAHTNLLAEKAVDRLTENKDKPDKVFLVELTEGMNFDQSFFINRIKDLLKKSKLKNTLFALKSGDSLVAEKRVDRDTHRVYLDIKDYAEAIAQEERVERIKQEIAETFLENIREIAQNAILSSSSMNPLQFTWKDGDDVVTGRIKLNRMDMAYPQDMPIREWLDERVIMRLISFEERVGSLAERGIDEMQIRDQRNVSQDMMNRMYEQYTEQFRRGRTMVMPRMSYSEWSNASASASASYAVSADTIRELQNADSAWEVPNPQWIVNETTYAQEYPVSPMLETVDTTDFFIDPEMHPF